MRKLKILIVSIVAAVAMFFMSTAVISQPTRAQSPLDALSLLNSNQPVMTCALDNIGWLVCPVLRSAAKAGDYAFTFITKSFLVIETELFRGGRNGTENAWALIRNIANAMFVLATLIVVYSLITGAGLSRYNIMKIVPRFLVMAIMVNISFYLCQAMIDIANIIGYGIINALGSVASTIGQSVMPLSTEIGSESSPVLTEVTSSILSKVDVAWALLAPVAAVVLFAAVICSILIVVLIARKTFVIALVLVAPLALVAYLLPNTEHYFKKWLNLFVQTLMLFPVIAFLLGVGQIVSAAIVQSGDSNYKVENDEYTLSNPRGGTFSASATVHLVAAGSAVLPLAATWHVFKFVLNGANAATMYVRRGGKPGNYSGAAGKGAKQNERANMFSQGLRRLQKMADGDESDSVASKIGTRRGRKKPQKSEEQIKFDMQVQARLKELRASGASAQDHYARTMQRYQGSQAQADSRQVNVNSYDSVELKAAEAYLLENISSGDLARDGIGRANQTRNNNSKFGKNNTTSNEPETATVGQNQSPKSIAPKLPDDSSTQTKNKAARNALASSGLSAPPPAGGSVSSGPAVIHGGSVSANNVVVVQSDVSALGNGIVPPGGGVMAQLDHQQTDAEMKAKARAAKFVMSSQEVQASEIDDMLALSKANSDKDSELEKGDKDSKSKSKNK